MRPVTGTPAGEVAGRRVLDAGCGSGPILAMLRDRGATVAGFDSSAKMLELARNRLGPDADLRVADPGGPLPYPDGAFDDVIAALVLHYLEDWTGPLAELRRVLRPGGRLIAAVDHPFNGHSAPMTFWERPLHAMTDAFTAAGFLIAVISEPPVAPDTPDELLPPEFEGRRTFLSFLFFVLETS